MTTDSLARDVTKVAAWLARFLWLLSLSTVVGAMIGGLVAACISWQTSGGESVDAVPFGAYLGSLVGFGFYGFAHKFVFTMPLGRVVKYLIGGTLIGCLPLALVPREGPIASLLGGMLGYWVGLVVLVMRNSSEQRTERENGGKESQNAHSSPAR